MTAPSTFQSLCTETQRPKTAIALSGGPDSMALLHLAKPDCAFIVDHGLRAESADEAVIVKKRAEKVGVEAHILKWEGEKPGCGIMELAREARYRLMTHACEQHDCTRLLVAHQQDDQIETYLMRQRRGSGWRGLAGMPYTTQRGSVKILRPLLDVPKAALLRYCQDVCLPFVDDPSNKNPSYTRARIRQEIRETLNSKDCEEILSVMRGYAHRRQVESAYHTHLFATYCTVEMGGNLRVDVDGITSDLSHQKTSEVDCFETFLSLLIGMISQSGTPQHQGKVASILHMLLSEQAATTSYSGCLLHTRQIAASDSGRIRKEIWIVREPSAISPLEIQAGEHNINWDGRLRLTFETKSSVEGDRFRLLAPLGIPSQNVAWRHIEDMSPEVENLPGIARASLPALWQDGKVQQILDGTWEPVLQPLSRMFEPDEALWANGEIKSFVMSHAAAKG